jgi:glutathione peroxidase
MRRFVRYALALALVPGVAAACSDLLDKEFRPLAGKEKVNLCERFDGQVLLVVNTASKCGFTPQYEGLEALHQKYAARGFAVVGFPSNDFMNQEPGNEEQIKEFCTLTYGVKFPMFEKVHVTGDEAVPFYRELAAAAGGEIPKWNFHKYLIDRRGQVVKAFGSRTKPDDVELVSAIEKALDEKAPATATGSR